VSPPAAEPPPTPISPGWQSALGAWLQAHKTYPDAARQRGDQGLAIVRLTVDHTDQVVTFHIVSGTGSTILDEAVEHLLGGARLPSFPPGMDQAQVTVTLQIRYTLEK
jgi:protein TonB